MPFVHVADRATSAGSARSCSTNDVAAREITTGGPGPDRQMRVNGYCLIVAEIDGERVG